MVSDPTKRDPKKIFRIEQTSEAIPVGALSEAGSAAKVADEDTDEDCDTEFQGGNCTGSFHALASACAESYTEYEDSMMLRLAASDPEDDNGLPEGSMEISAIGGNVVGLYKLFGQATPSATLKSVKVYDVAMTREYVTSSLFVSEKAKFNKAMESDDDEGLVTITMDGRHYQLHEVFFALLGSSELHFQGSLFGFVDRMSLWFLFK